MSNSTLNPVVSKAQTAMAMAQVQRQLAPYQGSDIASLCSALYGAQYENVRGKEAIVTPGGVDVLPDLQQFERGPMARANTMARQLRANPFMKQFPTDGELLKSNGALAKAAMDVGFLTNLAQVTGGQALSFVSMDTNIARGTIRPGSFTLYQMLKKSRANQVVDFWPYAAEIGGSLPGAAYAAYSSATNGALGVNNGIYDMNTITLKLALDGRAITMALAAQNQMVDIARQETTNACMAILQSVDWALYWGNPTLWANQPQGLQQNLLANAPSSNMIDFQQYATANSNLGLSNQQLLFNLIYQQVSNIVGYRKFGIPTHAVMGVGTAGDLQSLIDMNLRQVVNVEKIYGDHKPIVINGNLQGMNTRFGDLLFPVDLLMTARDIPAQAIVYADGSQPITTTGPTKPASVTVAVSGANAGSDWTSTFTASSGVYMYAVASTDALMNESGITTSASVSGIGLLGAYVLTIAPPGAADAAVFRVYRSGLGFTNSGSVSGQALAAKFRHIGDVAANGASNVTYVDLNTKVPGSETIFILDMDETDDAFDYRWLLPLTKIELFAQNIYMPWAVGHIGAPRVRISKFHGFISNYVPETANWNPLTGNANTF